MVFGHYSISIKTVNNNELPPQLQPALGSTLELVVRVAHLMWIPFFPFEKAWTLKQGSNRYKVTPQVEQMLNQTVGRKNTPWYAFAGPIIIFVGMAFFKINGAIESSNRETAMNTLFENTKNEVLGRIQNPSENDYYTMAANSSNTVFKVKSFSKDSIVFWVPTSTEKPQRWHEDGWKVGYFENPNALLRPVTVAKKDLEKTYDVDRDGYKFKGMPLSGMNGQNLVLNELERIDKSNVKIEYVDEIAGQEVKAVFDAFMASYANIDSSLLLMDSASTNYFKDMLRLAKADDFMNMKTFVEGAAHPLPTYKSMLFTKYSYLSTTKKGAKQSAKEELKDYGFYLKLLEQGLWILDFEKQVIGKINTSQIKFNSTNQALVAVNAPSNMLSQSENISFNVELNKEDGKWKINIPSSFAYTTQQINRGIQGRDRKKQFRQMAIDEVKKLEDGKEVSGEWFY